MSTPTISNTPGGGKPSPSGYRTKLISALVAVAVVLVAAAIILPRVLGNDDAADTAATPSGTATSAAADPSAAYTLVKPGTLTVATEGTYKPFSYHEDGSGTLVGYDVEIAQAVGKKLNLTVAFEETQWDAIFAGLEAGRFDVIANQVSINDERQAKYLLSDPYTISPGALIVPEDNTDITTFESLKGKTTAQSLTSNWYELAKSYGAKVEGVEGWAQSVELLKQGRVDATINDKLTLLDYQKTNGASGLKIAAETTDPSRNAFALKKGNDALLADINTALGELQSDGTLAAIGEKYFGTDVSQ